MKQFSRSLLLVAFMISMVGTGCSGRLSSDGPYAGDSILYGADKTITSSYRILHSFVKWEYQHRAVLPVEITRAADVVRANAEKWTQSAINLREAYAANPSKENGTALQKSIDMLDAVLGEVALHMTDWDGRVTNPPAPQH